MKHFAEDMDPVDRQKYTVGLLMFGAFLFVGVLLIAMISPASGVLQCEGDLCHVVHKSSVGLTSHYDPFDMSQVTGVEVKELGSMTRQPRTPRWEKEKSDDVMSQRKYYVEVITDREPEGLRVSKAIPERRARTLARAIEQAASAR